MHLCPQLAAARHLARNAVCPMAQRGRAPFGKPIAQTERMAVALAGRNRCRCHLVCHRLAADRSERPHYVTSGYSRDIEKEFAIGQCQAYQTAPFDRLTEPKYSNPRYYRRLHIQTSRGFRKSYWGLRQPFSTRVHPFTSVNEN
jgi:hypothetical protein